MVDKRALVAGAGGFIGGHLVKRLLDEGYWVRAVDIKPAHEWHQWFFGVGGDHLACGPKWDLSDPKTCAEACRGMDEVYNLAADMGGMGFIETHKLECMLSVLINTNLLLAAFDAHVRKYFFSSSACVYPGDIQNETVVRHGLEESEAYPADPEDGYGWEKLFSERMCRHFYEDRGLEVRIGRYHNVYGPYGTWEGGREKAPAALCRKIAECELGVSKEIEIWGNGKQLRSFMYIADCIEGTRKLMESDHREPINIGSNEMVTITQLADRIEQIASPGYTKWRRAWDLKAPKGVQGRNSDNTLIKQVLGWEPQISLDIGLRSTYEWIYNQLRLKLDACP